MRNTFLFSVIFFLLCLMDNSYADCPAFNVSFNNQADVDKYLPDGGCPVIMGDLTISGAQSDDPIRSIAALSGITQIGGRLLIQSSSLTSLGGLEALTSVTHIWLQDNPALASMQGLDNLTSLIQLDITRCHSLTQISVGKVTSLFGLNVVGANSVKDMTGLGSLESIPYMYLHLEDMNSLESLNGLTNLKELSGIWLENCPAITDISALNGLAERLNDIYIVGCSSLTACSIAPVCNFLKTRSTLGGSLVTSGNGSGCSEQAMITSCEQALPVILTKFQGKVVEDHVDLFWSTAQEVNSKEFQIEHSENASDWNVIGSVQSNENTTSENNYQFIHYKPGVRNYYRLKLIDQDNSFVYSSMVYLKTDQAERLFTLYPNPASEYIIVDQKYVADLENIQVMSLSGTVLLNQSKLKEGKVDIKALHSGSYIVKARFSSNTETSRRIFVSR